MLIANIMNYIEIKYLASRVKARKIIMKVILKKTLTALKKREEI